jgi:O-antigen/teichoic acid export membrane protein
MNLKLFGKNTIIYGIGNIGLRASAFLLIPLYTHILSIREYGLLATLLLTIQIMIILMSVGMRTTFLRFAKEYQASNPIGHLLGSSLLVNVIAGITIIGATLIFLEPFFCAILHVDHVTDYLALTGCAALLQTLSLHLMSYYQANNNALKFTLVGLSAALLLLITSLVLLLICQLGLKGALIAYIVTYGAVSLFLSFDVLFKKTGIGISFTMIPKLLQFGSPLVFSMLGQVIMGASSIYFLSHWEGLEVVAVYSLGYKLATVVGIVLTLPFQLAYQPFVFGNIDKPDLKETMARLLTYFFVAVALISFSILLASRALLPFIAPPEYSSAFLVIILMLPAVACNGLIIFGETLVTVVKKTHVTGIVAGTCSILSLLSNYALVPVIGWYGAVIASFVSYVSAGLTTLILGMKAFPMPIEWLRTSFAAGMFICFLLLVFLLHTKGDLIFYGVAIIATCLLVIFAKFGNFFDGREKAAITRWFKAAKLNFSA